MTTRHKSQVKTYKFPPMLGPAEDWPEGSAEWALRFANRLSYTVANVATFGIEPIIPLVEKAIEYQPWKIWPENHPAGSIDRFFLLITGTDFNQIYALIRGYVRDDNLARRLAAAKGKDESVITQGQRTDLDKHRNEVTKLGRGNSGDYILRRLARNAPDILAAYERGEFETARDAARAAGIKVDATPLELLRRTWRKASEEERAIFLREAMDNSNSVKPRCENVSHMTLTADDLQQLREGALDSEAADKAQDDPAKKCKKGLDVIRQ